MGTDERATITHNDSFSISEQSEAMPGGSQTDGGTIPDSITVLEKVVKTLIDYLITCINQPVGKLMVMVQMS